MVNVNKLCWYYLGIHQVHTSMANSFEGFLLVHGLLDSLVVQVAKAESNWGEHELEEVATGAVEGVHYY